MKVEFSWALALDHSKAAFAEQSVEPETHDRVEDKGRQHYKRELGAVDENHRQSRDGHQAIDRGRNHAFGKGRADWLNRGETREDVSDVPFLEIRNRQPD